MRRGKMIIFIGLIMVIMSLGGYALTKPIEGTVYDDDGPLPNARVILYIDTFRPSEGIVHCYTRPMVLTDSEGYFINDVANLRRMDNSKNCEDLWRRGDPLNASGNGWALAGENAFNIPDESGAVYNLGILRMTDTPLEPLNLSKKDVGIAAHNYFIDWKNQKVRFNVIVRNNMSQPAENLKMRISIKDMKKKEVAKTDKGWFGLKADEIKNMELETNVSGLEEGNYIYTIILYDAIDVLDLKTDNPLEYRRPKREVRGVPMTADKYLDIWVPMCLAIIILLLISTIVSILEKKRKDGERK